MGFIAVIDTETNWKNKVMSIGVVIAEETTLRRKHEIYYIFNPEYRSGGMFFTELPYKDHDMAEVTTSRGEAMSKINSILEQYEVQKLFAYNAKFDKGLLEELQEYQWYDIMAVAANKKRNTKIPDDIECYASGKMKRGYGVEPMMKLLTGNFSYKEVHNALCDAQDELELMRLIGLPLEAYEVARI